MLSAVGGDDIQLSKQGEIFQTRQLFETRKKKISPRCWEEGVSPPLPTRCLGESHNLPSGDHGGPVDHVLAHYEIEIVPLVTKNVLLLMVRKIA